jgi:hypothetical protein
LKVLDKFKANRQVVDKFKAIRQVVQADSDGDVSDNDWDEDDTGG